MLPVSKVDTLLWRSDEYAQQTAKTNDEINRGKIDTRHLTMLADESGNRGGMDGMVIPLIFFTIVIDKRVVSAEKQYMKYRQMQLLEQLENERRNLLASLPRYFSGM